MISQAVCDCGVVLDNEQEIRWHRTTEGHIWNRLKKEMDGNYDYTKKKIPKDAKCNTCNELVNTKRSKGAPKWYTVLNKDGLTVRCKMQEIQARFNQITI